MPLRQERGIVADWFVKLLIGFVVIGVIGFDGGSILVNYFTLDSTADDVAIGVSTTVGTSGAATNYTAEEIRRLALQEVSSEEGGTGGIKVLREGTGIDQEGVVRIRLRRVANTLLVKRITPIAKWARATAEGQAGTT